MVIADQYIVSSDYETFIDQLQEHLAHLIDTLSSGETARRVEAKRVIKFNDNGEQQCHLLLQGTIELARARDNFVIYSEKAPAIFGLSNIRNNNESFFLKTIENSEIVSLPLNKACKLISENNLWASLSYLLMHKIERLSEYSSELTGQSAYDIIRYQLYKLLSETETVRLNVTAANYILTRTFLSRSCVMKILAQLKKVGYITTERGVLKSIDKLIPLRY